MINFADKHPVYSPSRGLLRAKFCEFLLITIIMHYNAQLHTARDKWGNVVQKTLVRLDACFMLSIVGVLCCVSQQLLFIELEGCSQ